MTYHTDHQSSLWLVCVCWVSIFKSLCPQETPRERTMNFPDNVIRAKSLHIIHLFNWRITSSQCCGGICHKSIWISPYYMYKTYMCYICVCVCMCVCVYIYIYIERERERETLPPIHPSRSSQSTRLGSLCYTPVLHHMEHEVLRTASC